MKENSNTLFESVQTHGEGLLRFPGGTITHHQLWLPDGLTPNFDKAVLFDRLIHSYAYTNMTLIHSYKGTHGPFAVANLSSHHYESLSAAAVKQVLSTRLLPTKNEDLTRYRDPWPSLEVLLRRLSTFLAYINLETLQWYRLDVGLNDEDHLSDEHRKAPILEHFDEWVGVDSEESMIYMLQVIRD
jgi:hypothetical protein